MNKLVNGAAILLISASLGACNRDEPAADADVAAEANMVVMPDENAMPADANATDNAAMMDANATVNSTKQGSTDH